MQTCEAITKETKNCSISKWEVGDIFRIYGESYRTHHQLTSSQLMIMKNIETCRTTALGGHLNQCDHCGHLDQSYNSCHDRHCPKCQSLAKARWLKQRQAELLPVGYFHGVFTLPHELNELILYNKNIFYKLLFSSVKKTLQKFAKNPKHKLGGQLGFTAILHTWDQRLQPHFHLHCLIPAGALSFDKKEWIRGNPEFLFNVKALAKVFRGIFLEDLKKAYQQETVKFPPSLSAVTSSKKFSRWLSPLYEKNWNVYTKKPFGGPEKVLDYLGRYTHRVAISNNRILAVKGGEVYFNYRDRKDEDKLKVAVFKVEKFISLFLLHELPKGFMKIRNYGFLGNRYKAENIRLIRDLLGVKQIDPPPKQSIIELMLEITGDDITQCPKCEKGKMKTLFEFPPFYDIGREIVKTERNQDNDSS